MNLELLLATRNNGKVKELKGLLADLPIILRSTGEFSDIDEPDEAGATFADNAILKARYYAERTGLLALADDSGLEVLALDGSPGVFSARYAGTDATNDEKLARLLVELTDTQDQARLARFACVMALADEKGEIINLAEGLCEGKIAWQPTGTNGFGYDSIFIPDGFSESFGELSDEVKQKISHRAQATNKIIAFLRGFISA